MMKYLMIALVACLGFGLHAQDPRKGEDAPKFKAGGKVINPPEVVRNLDDCKGNVVLIYEWNIRDGSAGGLKDIQRYWDDYKGKGLNIFTIHRLNYERWPEVTVYCRKEGYTFPVAMGGFYDDKNDFFQYMTEGEGFRTTVIGTDGKIKYYGKKEWEKPLKTELENLVYPNLGKNAVHEEAERAAKYFADRRFGKAITEAEELLKREDLPEAAEDDAELIIERSEDLADDRLDRIEDWKEEGRYDLAYNMLELLEDEYKTHKIADEADEAAKAMKKDRDVRDELDALEKLQKLNDAQTSSWMKWVSALKTFAVQQREHKAGAIAEKLAKDIEWEMSREGRK